MKFKKLNNILTKGAILLTIFMLIVSSFLFVPQRAQAQFVVSDIISNVWDAIKWAWDKGGAVAYRNSLNFFLQQAAKQSGEYLATGDAGKKPAFLTDPNFYTKVGDQMLGEFVDSVASNFLGQSLCDTLDPTIKFNMLATMDPEYKRMKWAEEPQCSFSQIKKNLKKASEQQLFDFSADVKEGKVAKQRSSISTVIQGDSILTSSMKHILDGKLDICPIVDNEPMCIDGSINWFLGNVFYFYEDNGIGAHLHNYTNKFEGILQTLRENEGVIEVSPGEEAPKADPTNDSQAAIEFEDLIEKLDSDTGTELWGLESSNENKLKYLDKWSSECLSKNVENICDDVNCADLCGIAKEDCNYDDAMVCVGGDDDSQVCNQTTNCQGYLLGATCEYAKPLCSSRIKRINQYTNQLIEWATTLYDMIAQVVKNWKTQQGLPDMDALEDAGNMFNPESNAMGIQMSLESKLFEKQTDAIEKSKTFRQIQGSMNAVVSKVSGIVKLPSTFVSEKARESVKAGTAGAVTTTGVAFADAVGVFANTFMSQYMKRIFTKGLNPGADSGNVETPDDEDDTPNPDTTSILSGMKVIPLNQASNEMSIYDEFAVCPSGIDQKYTSQFNCLLDNKLARAVEERITIQEAMDNDLLNPEERLGIISDTRGLLSKSHVQKLRLIGVVPLGMQIATEVIMENQYTNGITLSDIVEGFSQRGSDGICGNSDPGESEFCNLIDPNWVLKAPSYLCEVTGYSAIPLRDSSFRQEACLDLKTCINETDGNQCDTWSYCTREKNVWRFGGDECDSQYNTCTSYTQKSNGDISSYLSNTLDFDDCSSSNVGCRWYCSNWDQTYSGIGGNWTCSSPGWREYTCSSGDLCDVSAGCNCTCDGDNGCPNGLGSCSIVEGGLSCSLDRPDFRNVAFFSDHIEECGEADEGCSQFIRIKSGLGVNFLSNGSFETPPRNDDTPLGWQASDSTIIKQILPSSGAQNGSNVVQILPPAGNALELSQSIDNVPSEGDFIVSGYYKKNSELYGDYYLVLEICYDSVCSDSQSDSKLIELSNNNWKDVSVSLSSNKEKSIDHINVSTFTSASLSGDIYVDSLQLRNETGNSVYREYGSNGVTYLKSAMGWMNCYDGDKSNDDVNCGNFVQKCESGNVGCELYTPINDNMSEIPALVSGSDLCPSACVGYETFEESSTNFVGRPDDPWVNLIPQTGQECSAPGCEEFTNLDILTQGGESREYYTYVRKCTKTNEQDLAIVDSSGDEISPASADTCQYYYTWVGEETSGYQLKKYYLEANLSLGGPIQVSATPNPDWGFCDEDHLDNPHCRQFYDSMGNIYYRLYKNTITCSKDCRPYRREVNDAIYMALESEGEVCGSQDVGCREYKGSTYGNMRNLFLDRFISSADPWQNVEISNESINRLSQSIRADNNIAQRPVDDLIRSRGKVYSLSLWVKGSGNYIASFGNDLYFIDEGSHDISIVSNDWQEIRFGSIYFNREPENDEKLIIQGPSQFYLDNINLNEIQDSVYLIQNSWNTPEVCDIDSQGNIFPGYMIGCQAYWDRSHDAHYFKSFSSLCPEGEVGCEAMIDTQNSISPFSEEFNSESPQNDEIVVPADDLIYRVYDTDKSCPANNKGCQKFGLPEFDSNQKAIGFTDIYLLNNPDLYKVQSTLCNIEGEGCQEYEGQVYFKEPTDNVCEYRENVFINGENKNGWFKTGTDNSCYIENGFPYQPYGSVYGIRSNTDPLYESIAGTCPESQNGCTQFINPVEQNLVLNSGFEIDATGTGVPDDWVPYAEPTQFSLESEDCLSGNCWRVDHPAGDSTSAGRQYIEIQPGSIYELSAWMKVSDISTGTSIIYIEYDDIDGNEVGSASSTQSGSTEGKWIKHTVTLKAPYNAIYARILVPYVDDLMDARIDNISLIEQNSPQGSYYYLNDTNIDKTSCNGMVGPKEGCILFNDTSISGNLFYDSASTYALSQAQGDISISASSVSSNTGGEGDSNVVLKVRRDRVCGEWLQCSGYRSVWDSSISEYRSVCDSWVRCDQLIGSGKQAQCGNVVFDPDPSVLDKDEYIGRDVSWSGMDYSGYSILDMYPIEKLFPSESNTSSGLYTLTYFDDANDMGVDGVGVDGLHIEKATRIYPEKDAPFKSGADTYYNKVNLCDSGVDDNFDSLYPDCQGSYQKVEYGDQYSGLTKYYNLDIGDVSPRKACKYSGKSCDDHEDCNPGDEPEPDKCVEPSKITQVIGLRGFCLEPDESRPEDTNACITWWPGASAGDVDVYNLHYSAGYSPENIRNWYCASDDSNPIFGNVYSAFEDVDAGGDCKRHVDGTEGFSTDLVDDYGFLIQIKQNEIEKIEIDLMGNDEEDVCGSHWRDNKELTADSTNPWWNCADEDSQGSTNCCSYSCGCSGGAGCISVEAIWDSDNYLIGFYFCCRDDSGNGASCGYRDIDIYLKSGCKYLISATPNYNGGLSIGYTDRLWSSGSYYEDHDGDQECTDYGATSITSPGRLIFVDDVYDTCGENDANVVYTQNSLQNLFMKIDERKSFNTNAMSYNIAESSWNETNSADPDDAPTITSVNGIVNAVSIGQYESGSIGPEISPYVANLKFYAWADTNHMPIREIGVDWDDSPNFILNNVISKNHRPECCESEIGCSEFGLTPDACVDKYFSFNHTYTCEGQGSAGWQAHACLNMCCFQPKVYVKDNWGWCAGDPGVYVGWDVNNNPLSCKNNTDAGIPYNGVIKVNANN